MAIKTKNGKVVLKNGKASCECCGCGCLTTPTTELIPILDAATTATCNGLPPSMWTSVSLPAQPGWYAFWAYSNIYTLRWYSDSKCLVLTGDNAFNILYSGICSDCSFPWSVSCVDQQYTINGVSFPCHTDIIDETFPNIVPPPSFVFS